jgi:hypothetical protein
MTTAVMLSRLRVEEMSVLASPTRPIWTQPATA